MGISLITRADDLGSSHSANLAIAEAAVTGEFIRNVSCMAVGPWIDAGAELLRDWSGICLGMHASLNAEWDPLKWGPVAPVEKVPTLVNEKGVFFNDPISFIDHPPDIDEVLFEYNHQLDLLTNLGLDIRYVDSHMLPELYVDGLADAVSAWVQRKGLIDHIGFYRFPIRLEPGPGDNVETELRNFTDWLDLLDQGTYFSVMHPAKASREMLLFTNHRVPVGLVSTQRDLEYRLLQSGLLEKVCDERGIRRLRYDEAESQGMTIRHLRDYLQNEGKENNDE